MIKHVLCALTLVLATTTTSQAKESKDLSEREFYQLFSTIVNAVQKDYVEKTTYRELAEAALQGMMTSLDPHSDFLTESEFTSMRETAKGNYGGLGVEILPIETGIRIINVMDGSPAEKVNLKAGDLIIAVEGESISRSNVTKSIQNIRGPAGSDVTLTIKRDNLSVFEQKVKRAVIEVSPVKWEAKGDVGYIKISLFNRKTPEGIKKAVRDLRKKIGAETLKGFVIDVRNNAGGLLDEGVETTEVFLKSGLPVVSIKGRDGQKFKEFLSKSSDQTKGLPLAVLVNSRTVSAAEIFAGALQDHKRAIIVGTKSFGKGSVQSIQEVKGIGALRMTIALFYTPSGRIIQQNGITPDIAVEQTFDLKTINSSKRLREAFFKDSIRGRQITESERKAFQESVKNLKNEPNFRDIKDYQLDQALNVVRTLSYTQKSKAS